jgi:hypothetical protein
MNLFNSQEKYNKTMKRRNQNKFKRVNGNNLLSKIRKIGQHCMKNIKYSSPDEAKLERDYEIYHAQSVAISKHTLPKSAIKNLKNNRD